MRRWPAAFFVLLGIVAFAFSAYEWCRTPLTPWYGESFGISSSLLGFIVGASTLTGVILKFPAGVFSDVFGRKRILIAGASFFAFTPALYWFAKTPEILLAVRFIHGCATAIYGPVATAVVADLFQERRAEAIGWYTAVAQCGKAIGTGAVGYAFARTDGNFALTYAIAIPIGFAAFLLACLIRLPTAAKKSVEPGLVQMRRSLREAIRDWRVIFIAATDGVVMIAAGAIQAFLPLYAHVVHGHSAERTGLLFSIQIVTSLLSRPLMGRISDRIGRKPMILMGMVLAAAAFAGIARTGRYEILLTLSAIFGLAEAVIHTSTTAFAADICKQRSLGSAMGIFGAVSDVGHAAGPILTGALLLWLGSYPATFVVVGGLVVLAAILFAVTMRTGTSSTAPPASVDP